MNILLEVLWFLLPAYFANMAPVFANALFKTKAKPIDFGKNIFGNHKTYRGFISGVLLAILIVYLQFLLVKIEFFNKISILDYEKINLILYGFLFGFGAMSGDLIKSFFKRKLKLKPGHKFIPLDQIDYVIGSFLFLSILFFPGWLFFFISLLVSFFANIIVNQIGYWLKLRESKW